MTKRSSKSSSSKTSTRSTNYNCSSGASNSRASALATTTPVTSNSWGQGSASQDFHIGNCGTGHHTVVSEQTRDGQSFAWVSSNAK